MLILNQSDDMIFESTIPPDEIDKTALFFCMLIQTHKTKKSIENILVEHSQKRLWPIWSQDSKTDSI